MLENPPPAPVQGRLTAALGAARRREQLALIASLPRHDLSYARAALRGGAHALKLHFGLLHRASGEASPRLGDHPDVVDRLRDLAPDVALGAVLGDSAEDVERDLEQAARLGLDFISGYAHALPACAFTSGLEVLVVLDDASPPAWAAHLLPAALLEASVVPAGEYGGPLTAADLLRYATLRAATAAPLVVPTQKRILPADLPALRQLGVDALMYGVIVTGPEPDGFEQAARLYLGA